MNTIHSALTEVFQSYYDFYKCQEGDNYPYNKFKGNLQFGLKIDQPDPNKSMKVLAATNKE